MNKIHIGKNGPAPCKANKGKCPLGGESGSENHFDDMKDAELAYAKQQGGSIPKTLNGAKTKEAVKKKFRHSFRRSAEELLGDDDVPIHYDQEEEELKREFDKAYSALKDGKFPVMETTVELDYYGSLPEEPDYSNYKDYDNHEDAYDEAMMDYQQDLIELQNRNTGEPADNGYATVKVHVFDSKDDFMEALKKSDELRGPQGEQEYYSDDDDNEVYYNDYVSRASNPHLGYVGKLEVFKA